MISHREHARAHGQYDIESKLHKQIKLSARADRKYWLETELVGAPWSAIKALRKLPIKKAFQIRDSAQTRVDSDKRGDTLADYCGRIQ